MVLHIKNMVCPRCVMAVENILQKLAMPYSEVKIGEVVLNEKLSEVIVPEFELELNKIGFEVINDPKIHLLENVRKLVREYLENESDNKVNLSVWLSEKLGYDYTYLSNLFSAETASTIEKYYITQRINKAKELLRQRDYLIADVAARLGYSSSAYLSAQFKKLTGMTPGEYKNSLSAAQSHL
jgi:AraC family transcriptional regulator